MDFETMSVKTTPGTTPGSVYVVAFEGDGLKVSIRPFVNMHPLLLSLALRVRVETTSPDGAVMQAKSLFGIPFEVKGGHASASMAVPIMAVPFGPKEAHEIVFSKDLINLLLDELTGKIMAHSKMKQVTGKDMLYEVIANQVRDQLPVDTICAVEHKVYYDNLSEPINKIKAALQGKSKGPSPESAA